MPGIMITIRVTFVYRDGIVRSGEDFTTILVLNSGYMQKTWAFKTDQLGVCSVRSLFVSALK